MVKSGCLKSREKIIIDNLGIVHEIAHKLAKYDLEELQSEGYLGLIIAVDRFDPDKNIKFSTFAYHYVWGYMQKYIRKESKNRENKKYTDYEGRQGHMSSEIDILAIKERLTKRQKQIFELFLKQKKEKEIASELGLAIMTVYKTLHDIKNRIRGAILT